MDTFEAIKKRKSSRRFLPREVSREDFEAIVDAGRLAPSANNAQPWEFLIIKNQEKKEHLAALTDHGAFLANASGIIVVFCKKSDHSLESGCAAVENMLISATAKGLGSCWIAGANKKYAKEIHKLLKIPGHQELIALVAIGYAAEASSLRPTKRLLSDVIHWEEF